MLSPNMPWIMRLQYDFVAFRARFFLFVANSAANSLFGKECLAPLAAFRHPGYVFRCNLGFIMCFFHVVFSKLFETLSDFQNTFCEYSYFNAIGI